MFNISDSIYNQILERLLSHAGNFADIYAEEEELFSFVIEDNKVKTIKTGVSKGINLRLINKEKTFCASTNDLSEANLLRLAQNISDTQNAEKNSDSKRAVITKLEDKQKFKNLDYYQDIINSFSQSSKRIISFSDLICQATLNYFTSLKKVLMINSLGECCHDLREYSRYVVNVVAKDGEVTQTAYEGPGITGKDDIFKLYPLEETADKVINRALLMLKAKEAPTGKQAVVLLGEAGGTMIHEACGHALEADFIYKGTSIFNNKLGQQIAADCVTVIDDATQQGIYGSYKYDDEGVPAGKTVLIENGTLKGYLTDRLNASLLGLKLTGNGRRESYESKPVPRMSNTFIENTTNSKDQIIDSVNEGILVKRMGGGQVNITNGEFIFEISEGYKIEKGKIAYPVRGASLIGSGPQVLMDIEAIANDKVFIPGVCGKYDHVPVGDAQPTLKIKEMTIGGR